MYCAICGDEDPQRLTGPVRFWSPDDGWRIARLCSFCREDWGHRQPRETDYAWDQRGVYVSDEDEAIDALYG